MLLQDVCIWIESIIKPKCFLCLVLTRVFIPAGRLVASLIVDFLQVFNLDFSLAVFQPEINLVSSREQNGSVGQRL